MPKDLHFLRIKPYGIWYNFPVKKIALAFALIVSSCVQASWYWPFESSEDNTNKPPRLHRLLEKANDFIEMAEDESLNGNADKALDCYRQAVDELTRVQMENPDRAETPEFAPLRNKMATCKAAIDTIRFEQINSNIRAVSVTDTAELQRKWNKRHGIVDPEDAVKPVPIVYKSAGEPAASKPEKANVPAKPADWNARLREAAGLLRSGNNAEAAEYLEKMSKELPDDLNMLIMHSAALAGSGRFYAARKMLEKAAEAHPQSYLPRYNLAYVTLELGEGRKVAQRYYDEGRELGGPVSEDLERRLKGE